MKYIKLIIITLSLICCNKKKVRTYKENRVLFDKAERLYSKKKYSKALSIYDDLVKDMKLNHEIIDIKIHMADCLYYDKEYKDSYKIYEDILNKYHVNDEYVMYMMCMSLANSSLQYNRDTTSTHIALDKIKEYLMSYPYGEYYDNIIKQQKILINKIYKLDIETIELYFILEQYRSAIQCCDNFLKDNKKYKEIFPYIYLMKIKSQSLLINKYIIDSKRKKQIKNKDISDDITNLIITYSEYKNNCQSDNQYAHEIDQFYKSIVTRNFIKIRSLV